jgi:pyrimidine deaminase RibD-like protein
MRENDEKLMSEAIALAERCKPIAGRIPKVGALIAVDDTIIGQGHRGTGESGDDDHAEKIALKGGRGQKTTAQSYRLHHTGTVHPRGSL